MCGFLACSVPNFDPTKPNARGWYFSLTSKVRNKFKNKFKLNIFQDTCKLMFAEYQRNYTPSGYFMGMTPDGAACGDGKVLKVYEVRLLVPAMN